MSGGATDHDDRSQGQSDVAARDWTDVGIVVGLVAIAALGAGILYLLVADGGVGAAGNGRLGVAATDLPDRAEDEEPDEHEVDVEALTTSVHDLEEGDCLNLPEEDPVERVAVLDCDGAHDARVEAIFDLDLPAEEPWRGDETVSLWAREGCEEWVTDDGESGAGEDEGELRFLRPSRESWNELGDRQVTCLLLPP